MKPILFPATSTSWNSNGLGALSDAVSCICTEERNGEYEIVLQYPVGGIHFDEIHDRAIILAKPSPYRDPQPFRIYSIESPLNGIVTIHAHHLSYDLSGIPVEPFTASSCSQALTGLTAHSVVTNPFSVSTDKNVSATYTLKVPTSFRACLGGQEGSILDVYGKGEYEFDKYSVKLWVNRGSDNGVKIAYGKNLTDFNMERNLESITTGIYPYWSDFEGTELVEVKGRIIKIYDPLNPTYLLESGGAYLTEAEDKYLTVQTPFNFTNIVPVDFSGDFEEKPTPEELYARAEKYILDNSLGVPRVSIDVSFIDLGQTEEYKDLAVLEACDLCDTVTVEFPMYGISVKSKIIRIETDVLLERYNSVEIGDSRPTIADTIATLQTTSATKTEVKNGNAIAADVINNTKGVFEWIDNDEDGENEGFTIYESDGVAFLRCTAGGIGLSQDGGFTYTNAITKYGVVASELDVESHGHNIFYAGYDEENEGIRIAAYHPDYDSEMFEITSGKWRLNQEPQDGSWRAELSLIDPEVDSARIQLISGKYSTDGGSTFSHMNQFRMSSGTDDYGGYVTVTGTAALARAGSNYNGNAQLGVLASNNGSIYLYANSHPQASATSPSLYVRDSTVDSDNHYLKLTKLTINGTQYYLMASTT